MVPPQFISIRLLSVIIFLVIRSLTYGQVYTELGRFSIRFSEDTNLFKPSEIKAQKIVSLCILDSISNLGYPTNNDTLFLYEFDSTGTAIHEVGFIYNKRDYDYNFKKAQSAWLENKDKYHFQKSDSDSIVSYMEVATIEGKIDTPYAWTSTFNKQGKIIEFKRTTSALYKSMGECNMDTHWKTSYDEHGREITHTTFRSKTTWSTTYTDFGRIKEEWDLETGKLLSKEETIIRDNDEFYSECDGSSLTIIYFGNSLHRLPANALIIPSFVDPVTHNLEFKYVRKK